MVKSGSLAETAQTYARLFHTAEVLWRESAGRAALNRIAPGPLPVPALEELRQVFHGPDAPPNVPLLNLVGDLDLLPDRPSQTKLQELRKALLSQAAEA